MTFFFSKWRNEETIKPSTIFICSFGRIIAFKKKFAFVLLFSLRRVSKDDLTGQSAHAALPAYVQLPIYISFCLSLSLLMFTNAHTNTHIQ